MTVLATLLGAALILAALRDIFHQLFHPGGTGSMSGALMSIVWRVFRSVARRRYPSLLSLAGPSALITVIASWVALQTVGWAFIYWPRLSEQFLLAPGLDPSEQQGFVDALYLSLVTLSNLSYGNIAPTSDLLRVLVSLKALIGFGLLTASLTWVVSIYPPLTRRRAFDQHIALVRDAESETGISLTKAGAEAAERRLEALTSQLVTIRSDLVQFPITYYFHPSDERFSLPANARALLRIAEEGVGENDSPAVRLSANELRSTADDFSAMLASSFLGLSSASTEEVLKAYARDQLRDPFDSDRE